MTTIILPTGNRVLVQIDSLPAYTGKLVLPFEFREQPHTGRVKAVGSRAKTTLKVDDRVLFARHGGLTLTADGVNLRLLDVPEVLALYGCTICGDEDHKAERCPHLE